MTSSKFYTGVGSRETPQVVLDLMREMARIFAEKGMTLRSGAADGADQAFELGWLDWYVKQTPWPGPGDQRAELYLPWSGFNKHDDYGCFSANMSLAILRKVDVAEAIASSVHPAWESLRSDGTPMLSQAAKKLHTRNVYQVLGQTLDKPSRFLVGYAKLDRKGNPKGGTATAMNLAKAYDVPVYNLFLEEHFNRFDEYVKANG